MTRVFFANSGAEANDAAVKLARKVTGRLDVIAVAGSFHGRTLSTLSLSGGSDNAAKYLPLVPGHQFVPFGDIDALAAALNDRVAAVIVEPVQGEGGVRLHPPGYLQELASVCRANGTLLIADEVQTGFCRTGTFFAVDAHNVQPDILTMGKGIAGGFPFAAFAMTDKVAAGVNKGDHGGTYCGNPLGCAAALAVVTYLLEQDVATRVADMGKLAMAQLQALVQKFPEFVVEVRGRGLLIGMQMHSDAQVEELTQGCLALGLMVTPTRNAVLRIIPNLLISEAELLSGLTLLETALNAMRASCAEPLQARCA